MRKGRRWLAGRKARSPGFVVSGSRAQKARRRACGPFRVSFSFSAGFPSASAAAPSFTAARSARWARPAAGLHTSSPAARSLGDLAWIHSLKSFSTLIISGHVSLASTSGQSSAEVRSVLP